VIAPLNLHGISNEHARFLTTLRGDYLDQAQKLDMAALKTGKTGHGCPKNWTKTGHFTLIPICAKYT